MFEQMDRGTEQGQRELCHKIVLKSQILTHVYSSVFNNNVYLFLQQAAQNSSTRMMWCMQFENIKF